MPTTTVTRTTASVRARLVLACLIPVFFLAAGCSPAPGDQATMIAPTQPMAVSTPPPVYPAELACDGMSGQVGLILKIGADGIPKDIRVEDSSGHPPLDQAAVEAVKGWTFQPGTSRGEPVETPLRVPVTFRAPDMDSDQCAPIDNPEPLQE